MDDPPVTIPSVDHPSGAPALGRVLTAMVTPFAEDGTIDHDAAGRLASWLVTEQGNDGLVINGTGGEAPTTSDTEKAELIRTVRAAVGEAPPVLAGVGTFDTAHSVDLAGQAAAAGASALLVVTPYYSKPPQAGLLAHFRAVAEATELPSVVYDIPHRSGVAVTESTMLELAEHPQIVAVKDAKGDLASSARVMAQTDLDYYCGEDNLTLAWLAHGAVGVVGTSTHFTGPQMQQLIAAHLAGDVHGALDTYRQIEPLLTGVFATQGPLLVKAGLARQGRVQATVRSPLVPATAAEAETFCGLLEAAGL